jgi:hypothetical protein
MPSIYEIYEYYLEPRDLKDKAHVVNVASARCETMPNPRTRKPEKKIVVRFENRRKSMILNKTQAGALGEISGTDDYTKWVGTEVVLVAGTATNGKNTIVITDRANSGDIDLMYPKDAPVVPVSNGSGRPSNIPADWWDARSDVAVKFAAEKWGLTQAIAWAKIDKAIKAEALSAYLSAQDFKDYVEHPSCVRA